MNMAKDGCPGVSTVYNAIQLFMLRDSYKGACYVILYTLYGSSKLLCMPERFHNEV